MVARVNVPKYLWFISPYPAFLWCVKLKDKSLLSPRSVKLLETQRWQQQRFFSAFHEKRLCNKILNTFEWSSSDVWWIPYLIKLEFPAFSYFRDINSSLLKNCSCFLENGGYCFSTNRALAKIFDGLYLILATWAISCFYSRFYWQSEPEKLHTDDSITEIHVASLIGCCSFWNFRSLLITNHIFVMSHNPIRILIKLTYTVFAGMYKRIGTTAEASSPYTINPIFLSLCLKYLQCNENSVLPQTLHRC